MVSCRENRTNRNSRQCGSEAGNKPKYVRRKTTKRARTIGSQPFRQKMSATALEMIMRWLLDPGFAESPPNCKCCSLALRQRSTVDLHNIYIYIYIYVRYVWGRLRSQRGGNFRAPEGPAPPSGSGSSGPRRAGRSELPPSRSSSSSSGSSSKNNNNNNNNNSSSSSSSRSSRGSSSNISIMMRIILILIAVDSKNNGSQ